MRNFCLTLILILTFCAVSFAQTNENSKCPAIDLIGPATIVEPGEIAHFTANVKDENLENFVYKWSVTGGTIIEERKNEKVDLGSSFEGKGKYLIKILLTPETAGEALGATVEIKGLPEGCPNSASEVIICILRPEISVVDEFSLLVTQIDRARLKALANQSQNNPSAQVYIIERFVKKTSPQAIKQKEQKTIDYLSSIGMDVSRFTFINGYADKNRTEFILVPAGAERPTCDECAEIEIK